MGQEQTNLKGTHKSKPISRESNIYKKMKKKKEKKKTQTLTKYKAKEINPVVH